MSVRIRRLAVELILPCLLVLAWWLGSADSTSPYFTPLSDNLKRFADTWFFERFASDALPSLTHFALGFAIAIVVGVLVGTLLGLSPRARRNLSPITEFFRAMPIAALVPAGLVILGPGSTMEVVLIAFGSCWPILVSTTDGVRGVDPVFLETARVYGLSPAQRIVRVIMPAAAPRIVAGLRIALAIALATMVISNMFSGAPGLGFFILDAERTFDTTGMWAGLILLGIVGYLLNVLFTSIESHALAWHRGWRASTLEGT
jgi:sulfonate transport system permease protein